MQWAMILNETVYVTKKMRYDQKWISKQRTSNCYFHVQVLVKSSLHVYRRDVSESQMWIFFAVSQNKLLDK